MTLPATHLVCRGGQWFSVPAFDVKLQRFPVKLTNAAQLIADLEHGIDDLLPDGQESAVSGQGSFSQRGAHHRLGGHRLHPSAA